MRKAIALIAILAVFLMLSISVVAAPKLGKITFIHYKKGFGKPGTECGNGICEPGENAKKCPADCGNNSSSGDTSNCYGFIAKGFKWKWTEPYLVNPTNADGLSADFVLAAVNAGVAEWESYGGNIFGAGSIDYNATFDDPYSDGYNEIVFGVEDPGVIAVANVWGVWWGKPSERYISEYDILFNDLYYTWGDATSNSALMDLQNIATHELGHGAGIDDLYDTVCIDETMYGYSTEGETKKRDLNAGDITGIQRLYS